MLPAYLKKMELVIVDKKRKYSPGDKIKVNIKCAVYDSTNFQDIWCALVGEEQTKWPGIEPNNASTEYKGNNTFLSINKHLTKEEKIRIKNSDSASPETYTIYFKFRLPENVPGSYESVHGWVKFFVRVIVYMQPGVNYKVEKEIDVVSPVRSVAAVESLSLKPLSLATQKNIDGSCMKAEIVSMDMIVPKRAFVVGEEITVFLVLNNMSRKDVKHIKVILKQVSATLDNSDIRLSLIAPIALGNVPIFASGVGGRTTSYHELPKERPRQDDEAEDTLHPPPYSYDRRSSLGQQSIPPRRDSSPDTRRSIRKQSPASTYPPLPYRASTPYPSGNSGFYPMPLPDLMQTALYPPARPVSIHPIGFTLEAPYPIDSVASAWHVPPLNSAPYPPPGDASPPGTTVPISFLISTTGSYGRLEHDATDVSPVELNRASVVSSESLPS